MVSDALASPHAGADPASGSPRLLGIFVAWRLQAYGYALAVIYAVMLVTLYRAEAWLVDGRGVPVYIDFTPFWVGAVQALHGHAATLYDPAAFAKVQDALVGAGHSRFTNWAYPPMLLLFLAPFAMLPYVAAFLTWDAVTLLGCTAVVYLIVRRLPAIAIVLAWPYTAWTVLFGHNALLTASLLGASLLLLERRPVLAGVFIGCLAYKPQYGILLPFALAASNQWRAFASAAGTTTFLACASIAAFGTIVWEGLPQGLVAQSSGLLLADPLRTNPQVDPRYYWGSFQTVYGFVRCLDGGAALAWLAQGVTAFGIAVVVWLVWRSRVRYALKAATLSAAALIATPYAFAYDMAILLIPAAFLASDQIRCGLLRGEQATMIALFVVSLSVLPTLGLAPIGLLITILLLSLILRRALRPGGESGSFA